MTAEPAIARNEYIDRPTAERETIGNEGSQVDQACAQLDAALDRLHHQWSALRDRLDPVRADEPSGEALLHDASPEPPKSRLARFLASRTAQVEDLAGAMNGYRDMIDL